MLAADYEVQLSSLQGELGRLREEAAYGMAVMAQEMER